MRKLYIKIIGKKALLFARDLEKGAEAENLPENSIEFSGEIKLQQILQENGIGCPKFEILRVIMTSLTSFSRKANGDLKSENNGFRHYIYEGSKATVVIELPLYCYHHDDRDEYDLVLLNYLRAKVLKG